MEALVVLGILGILPVPYCIVRFEYPFDIIQSNEASEVTASINLSNRVVPTVTNIVFFSFLSRTVLFFLMLLLFESSDIVFCWNRKLVGIWPSLSEVLSATEGGNFCVWKDVVAFSFEPDCAMVLNDEHATLGS